MSLIFYSQFFIISACVHIFTIWIYIIHYSDILLSKSVEDRSHYDYIIVGSGTAGSLLAHRIATETNYSSIVLEAGSQSNAMLEIPTLGPLLHKSVFDWQFETVPQAEACLAMNEKRCRLITGKILGGSSKLNNMIYIRGNISHYTSWFQGKHTQEYIMKQFDFIEKNFLHLNTVQYGSELADATLRAAEELGYGVSDSPLYSKGFNKVYLSQKNGKRWTTSDNLDTSKNVLTNVLVEKVLLNGNTAYGVKVRHFNKDMTLYAKKAVILSAGTYNTPKILQLSGIGPRSLLQSVGIPVLKDLPVGQNLQDHVTTGLDLVVFNNSLSVSAIRTLNPMNVLSYFLHGAGPFTYPGCDVIGFLSTKNESYPDIQLMVMPVGISSDRGSILKNNVGVNSDTWNKYFVKTFDKHSSTILPIVLHPRSKGTVFIKDKDSRTPPMIDPKFFSDKEDMETLKRGLKSMMKFISTDSMKALGAQLNTIPFPGCEELPLFSDKYLECYIRHLTLTSYHPAGTCAMGDENSVVDTSFKVNGVSNLFVVDASVMPTMPSGNINGVVAMLASVFFDTNFKSEDTLHTCSKRDVLFDNLYTNICSRQ